MKFNPVVVRAIMQTQFDELKRINGTKAAAAEEHYPFLPQEVDEIFFARPQEGRGVWFHLKDGRNFDVHGELADKSVENSDTEIMTLRPALREMIESMDVMDKMPLAMIPLSSASLRSARLIKNVRLESMLEVHADKSSGSLQIRPENIRESFPRYAKDQKTVCSLAELHSYDVFSLRMNLRRLGIPVDAGALDLSEQMKAKLERYTPEFTVPLVRTIFGAEGADIRDRQGLFRVFRDPDRAAVAQKLRTMSQKTGVPMEELPQFLENYADTFLSVAYYQHNFEMITPQLTRCAMWLRDTHLVARGSAHCKTVEEALGFLAASIRERFRLFRSAFDLFWNDMSVASFQHLRQEIEGRYIGAGAMLCGLAVKMRHWSQTFQSHQSGGPSTRLQYLASEMEPGLVRLCEFAAKA